MHWRPGTLKVQGVLPKAHEQPMARPHRAHTGGDASWLPAARFGICLGVRASAAAVPTAALLAAVAEAFPSEPICRFAGAGTVALEVPTVTEAEMPTAASACGAAASTIGWLRSCPPLPAGLRDMSGWRCALPATALRGPADRPLPDSTSQSSGRPQAQSHLCMHS